MAVLLHCGFVAFSLRNRRMVESRPGICASFVFPRIDPADGSNGTLTAGRRPLYPTRISFDALKHCYLR